MTPGARVTRRAAAVLTGLALTVSAAPAAHAASSSPHQSVDRFWSLVSNGEGAQAFALLNPSCRTPRIKKQLIKAADQFDKLPVEVRVAGYHQHVTGHVATVSYNVLGTYRDMTKVLSKIHDQRWLLKDGRWYAPCR